MSALTQQLDIHLRLKEHVHRLFPDVDEETLRDTVEGLSNLDAILGEVVRSLLQDEALADALRARLADMKARLQRLEHRSDTMRAAIAKAMSEAALPRLALPEATVSLKELPEKLVVADETAVPARYWKPQPPKLDRRALLESLKSGGDAPGVALSNGGITISVRLT